MRRTRWQRLIIPFGSFLLSAMLCNADTINIDLMPALLSGSPGSTILFSGTLSNTSSSTVFLNSAGINLSGGFTPADEHTGPFFVNAPLFLNAAGSTPAIGLFTVDIPDSFAKGPYLGTFSILGGANGNAQDIVGSVNFTVQVVSPVPEPNSSILLGLVTALFLYRTSSRAENLRRQAVISLFRLAGAGTIH